MRKFTIVRARQPFPQEVSKSLFLLGPVPKTAKTKHLSWKPRVYRILERLGFDGVIYEPEQEIAPDQGEVGYDEAEQIDWEVSGMRRSDVIIGWIARQFPELPAMTSNIELGEFFRSGKLFLGYPPGTPRIDYINYRATDWLKKNYGWSVPIYHDLEELLQAAVLRLGAGAKRVEAETAVPLDIWQDKTFQNWYGAMKLAGHKLLDLTVEYSYFGRQEIPTLKHRLWAIRPSIQVAGEKRRKNNEVVIGRSPSVAVLMFLPHGKDILNWEVVLVKEFRQSALNHKGFVYELPSGAVELLDGRYDERASLQSAWREVFEETGLTLDASRLHRYDIRQSMATMLAHEIELYTYCLEGDELGSLLSGEPTVGQVVNNKEKTYPFTMTVKELLDPVAIPLDWVNTGMIMNVMTRLAN